MTAEHTAACVFAIAAWSNNYSSRSTTRLTSSRRLFPRWLDICRREGVEGVERKDVTHGDERGRVHHSLGILQDLFALWAPSLAPSQAKISQFYGTVFTFCTKWAWLGSLLGSAIGSFGWGVSPSITDSLQLALFAPVLPASGGRQAVPKFFIEVRAFF